MASTTFNQDAGSVGGPGTLSIYSVTANFTTDFSNTETTLLVSNSTINGSGTLTNANSLNLVGSTINSPFTNSGDLLVRGGSAINSGPGEFTTGASNTIRIEGSISNATGSLWVANGFSNPGTIELGSVDAARTAQLTIASGTLLNTNHIDVQLGTGGNRYLYGAIDNQGTIDFGTPTTVSTSGAAAYTNSGDINIANGTVSFSFSSDTFSNSGTIDITGGNLSIPSATSFTNTGDITIGSGRTLSMASTTFNQDAGSVGGPGTLSIYSVTANFTTDFSNTETTLLVSNSTINGSGTLTNANSLNLVGSTINSPFTNSGDLLVRGGSAINSGPGEFTTGASNTIRIEGSISNATGSLWVANGFSNPGTIELGSVDAARTAQLTIASGTLLNTNHIDVQLGTGGNRYLYGAIDNQGTIDFGTPTTVSTSGAVAYTNSGGINVAGVSVSFNLSSDTFSSSGTIDIADGGQLYLNGGTFTNFSAGTLTGGSYDVAGIFKFTGAAITTNAADIVLDGAGAAIVNQSGVDAMPGLANIGSGNSLEITNGHNLSLIGALASAGDLTVGDGSTLTVSGDLTQTNGRTVLDNGTITVSTIFDLTAGELAGSGTIDGDLESAGTTTPGSSPGLFVVTGSHTQTASHLLEIELTGTDPADYDRLTITGTAAISGELAVTLPGGFAPPGGTTYDIVTGSSVSPTFTTANIPLVYPGGCLDILYPGDRVRLQALLGVTISTPPLDQTICPGDPVTFTVGAIGGGTLDYQWRKNGIDIPLANSSSFSIATVTPGDAGTYDVVVGNLCGNLPSAPAELILGAPPVVITDPASQTAYQGQPVKFTIEADADPAADYQWRKDSFDLPGEVGSSLVLHDVGSADEGNYDVVVTNDCGSETSAAAALDVLDPPTASIGRSFCTEPDRGLGQAEIPPELCEYLSPTPGDIFVITEGLPSGATIEAVPVLGEVACLFSPCGSPGGALGGEIELFDAALRLHMTGTGALTGFNRIVTIGVAAESHSGPRTPGNDIQSFDVDLYSLAGTIIGDPDFDHLEIRAGTGMGMPSPGTATLIRRTGVAYSVDESFGIGYEIEFVGAPGSALDGFSGTTAGTAALAVAAPPTPMDACLVANTGGTAELPPAGCVYNSHYEPLIITDGLPAGSTLELRPTQVDFVCLTTPCGQPGGSLDGEIELYDSTLELTVRGTGTLAGFQRNLGLGTTSETHSAPRTSGDPVQHFITATEDLTANLVGDPDFSSLVITAGGAADLPSPGMTTLTDRLDGTFAVDSFFDVSYQIDFIGAPGSALDGFAGTSFGRVGVTATAPPLFADGFESGDLGAWN